MHWGPGTGEEAVSLERVMQTRGDTRVDICQMFLACLQLANAGNVLIERPGGRWEGTLAPVPWAVHMTGLTGDGEREQRPARCSRTPFGI